jgi:hypothetical protein
MATKLRGSDSGYISSRTRTNDKHIDRCCYITNNHKFSSIRSGAFSLDIFGFERYTFLAMSAWSSHFFSTRLRVLN